MYRTIRCIALVAFAMLIAAPAAFGHVTAQPPEQPRDGFTKITFRVPNERPQATTAIKVQFPDLVSVSVMPVPGWEYKVTKRKLDEPMDFFGEEVTEVTDTIEWTGGTVKPGEFFEFPVSVKLPAKGELGDLLFFPATQTYEGGEVVKWIEKPEKEGSAEELEHPAPSVTLVDEDDDAAAADDDSDSADDGDYATHDHVHSEIKPVRIVSWAALLVAVLGLLYTLLKSRRRD
jgi:uncharacterized protein YcnI